MSEPQSIGVVGLGYVGLPLAVGLARRFKVFGFDANAQRVEELRTGMDRNLEVAPERLRETSMTFSSDPAALRSCGIFIITVPTPVDESNQPDLKAVCAACRTIGGVMKKGSIVVLESTVYPGVTEDICGPEIEKASGLKAGTDFFLGYSPERINPGDREHTVDRITKVVAGQTPAVAERLKEVYGSLNNGNIFVAKSIRVAEAAKVIENAQRDINIAFVNEIAVIFNRSGMSVYDVLEAARTKWNFLPFTPGLVGGHCIGVDPFYLANFANKVGHHPAVILAGRQINDEMGVYIADRLADQVASEKGARTVRALILGLTFKENVPDLRNSKVVDIMRRLEHRGVTVDIHDPWADAQEARHEYKIELLPALPENRRYDIVIGAIQHDAFRALTASALTGLLEPNGVLADIKGMWRHVTLPTGYRRWSL